MGAKVPGVESTTVALEGSAGVIPPSHCRWHSMDSRLQPRGPAADRPSSAECAAVVGGVDVHLTMQQAVREQRNGRQALRRRETLCAPPSRSTRPGTRPACCSVRVRWTSAGSAVPVDRDLDALVLVVVGQRDADVTVRPIPRDLGFVGLGDDFPAHRRTCAGVWGVGVDAVPIRSACDARSSASRIMSMSSSSSAPYMLRSLGHACQAWSSD